MLVPNGLFVTRDESGYYKVVHVPSGKSITYRPYATELEATRFAQSLERADIDWWGTTNHLEKKTSVAECITRKADRRAGR